MTTFQLGHQLELLQGGQDFFPALIEAIDASVQEVRIETYIFNTLHSGARVAAALERAAARGVAVYLVMDGVGTPTLEPQWRRRFQRAGVAWHIFAPMGRLGLLIPGRWRRLHRKLCVVDERLAFCGGINLLDDFFDPNHGRLSLPRLDFAVRVSGPLVQQVQALMTQFWWRLPVLRPVQAESVLRAQVMPGPAAPVPPIGLSEPRGQSIDWPSGARAALVLRDNLRHRTRIERTYRRAIGEAKQDIIIANAYFLPGRKLRQSLIDAAQRGVRVRLLLQGRYEYFMQYHAARPVYRPLLAAGIEIYEYSASFLHAKVAVIDQCWATVGSSNLDPLSLLLAREANLVTTDPVFALDLRCRLEQAIEQGGVAVEPASYADRPWRQGLLDGLAFGLMRLALFLTGKRY